MPDETQKIIDKMGKMSFGLGRTRALLDKLGSPDDALKIIHIAGTNGKGSIAEYITRILVAAGKKTGTFTSPLVVDYCDQFRVDGQPLSRQTLNGYSSEVLALGSECTSFELMTAVALCAFRGEGCEYAVIECGLGGLEDATNAINRKELAVISSIGLEHTAILGDTIEKICVHKAGIIKNCPVVINALQPPQAARFFTGKGIFAQPTQIEDGAFTYKGERYSITAAGPAQIYNAAAAVEAALILGIKAPFIKTGLLEARLRGRIEIIRKGENVYIVDGAHNPASFEPLASVLKQFDPSNTTIIFGCLSDKDVEGNLKAISGLAAKIIAIRPESDRAMELTKITAACGKYFPSVAAELSVSGALNASSGVVVVCGSFTLVKEALNWIEKKQ